MTSRADIAEMQRAWASVRFVCPICGSDVGNTVPLYPAGQAAWTGRDEVNCDGCGSGFTVTAAYDQAGAIVGQVLEHPEVLPEVFVFDAGGFADVMQFVPEDPLKVFLIALAEVADVRHALKDAPNLPPAANRMLLIQLFSIIEAFLSDRLKREAIDSAAVRKRLASRVPALRDVSLKLSEVAKAEDILTERVISYLQRVSFHDFGKADELYRAAFQTSILPLDGADRDFLDEAVAKRHDCVHRNGRTLNGDLAVDVDRAYLNRIDEQFAQMAIRADQAILDAAAL